VRRQDEAWALVSEFGRLIREAQPDLVTMENVPQLEAHSVFRGFLDALGGYHVWFDTVDCTRYGVPQTRKRLVLLASRLGPVSLSGRSVRTQKGASTVRQAICHLTALRAGASDPRDPLHKACRLSPLNLRRIRASRPGGTWREWDPALVTRCHRDRSGETYPSVYGRMEWDAPAPTITTQCFGYGNGRFGHPEQDRAITLREAAILQTFPEGYEFVPPGSPVQFSVLGRLIGNAVPVRLGEVVARTLVKHVQAFS
jgi:DNA (cytosine-5)-methyltransferase 1